MDSYSFKAIEKKWQKKWEEQNTFKTLEQENLEKFYILEMFPYPSGKIHMGHVRNYAMGDVIARYKKAKGYKILHPMGWDAFGLPAENAARENNSHPMKWTYENIGIMRDQLKRLGLSIDWDREVITCAPEYYKHEQTIFIELFKNNLAYKKESWVNWDPIENTVLANEQVVDGKGWRSGALVEQKKLSQWFLKTTDFAEELLKDLQFLDKWPEKVKNMQTNWIGKSKGALINFAIANNKENIIQVYSTRPETIFGGTFLAISIQHDLAIELGEKSQEIKDFIKKCQALGTLEENISKEEKLGIDTGFKAINPVNNKEIPVFIANYVLNYGTKAIFGCPAHDGRDFEFAKKYNIAIQYVICPTEGKIDEKLPQEEISGTMINSEFLDNLSVKEAYSKIIKYLIDNNFGEAKTSFRLNDWGVSRQRYWGAPIPIIYCDSCGCVPEKEENLPVVLPEDVSFEDIGNPLETHPTWKFVKCPYCGNNATRETDTFDTFFESSWYFLRYITINSDNPFDQKLISKWMPVDQYIGGIEHAVMHLLYSRFFVKALDKIGIVKAIKEPFSALMTQGMICHKTYKTLSGVWKNPNDIIFEEGKYYSKDTKEEVVVGRSEKMSKSKKNVVDPDYICKLYGADSARIFVLSDSPPDKDLEWTDEGAEGIYKFLNRIWRLVSFAIDKTKGIKAELVVEKLEVEDIKIYKNIQKYLVEIENNINEFHLNKAIALNREVFNLIEAKKDSISINLLDYAYKTILKIFNPFVPHICEELWEKTEYNSILANESWVLVDKNYLGVEELIVAIQVMGKTRGTIEVKQDISQNDLIKQVLAMEGIKKYIGNNEIKRVVYVKGKIINFVI